VVLYGIGKVFYGGLNSGDIFGFEGLSEAVPGPQDVPQVFEILGIVPVYWFTIVFSFAIFSYSFRWFYPLYRERGERIRGPGFVAYL
jgi:hypothetical protein